MENSKLKLKKVVLFSTGVGYFERVGGVQGSQKVTLSFKSDQMNDVLKSLTAIDMGEGKVTSLSYDSNEPLEKKLAESLGVSPDLAKFFNSIQGAQVSFRDGQGLILGVREENIQDVEGRLQKKKILSILDASGKILQEDLAKATDLKILDEDLRQEMGYVLQLLLSEKKKDTKEVTLYTQGEGDRDLFVSYLVEAPVWKTSYRVMLDSEEGKDSHLQGWGLVDNPTDEDWDGVEMVLVSGKPISFVHDLYSTRYKKRPVLGGNEEQGNFLEESLESAQPMMTFASAGPPRAGMRMAKSVNFAEEAILSARQQESLAVDVSTEKVGDLFKYEISNPVTMKRNESGMVPIVNEKFQGSRISYYHSKLHNKNPMSAIYFQNTTGKTLQGGPLTVMEKGGYAGEAYLETIKDKEKKILPFSVDQDMVFEDHEESYQKGSGVVISVRNGSLIMESYLELPTVYKIKNNSDKEKRLFLDHAKPTSDFKLHEPSEFMENKKDSSRFDLKIQPGELKEFKVVLRKKEVTQCQASNLNQDRFELVMKNAELDPAIKDQVQKIKDRTEKKHQTLSKISALELEIGEKDHELSETLNRMKGLQKGDEIHDTFSKRSLALDAELQEMKEKMKALKSEKESDVDLLDLAIKEFQEVNYNL